MSSAGANGKNGSDAEGYLLSSCLLDGPEVLAKCEEAGIVRESFHLAAHAEIYDGLLTIWKRGDSPTLDVLGQELRDSNRLQALGGFPFLIELSARVPTTAEAPYFIEKVRLAAMKRRLEAEALRLTEAAKSPNLQANDLRSILEQARETLDGIGGTQSISKPRSVTSFSYPSDNDPGILLGQDDYLGRGGGFLFISHAGAGKSSWTLDACMMWAVGRPWMGIRCNGPLRSLVIQAEDSDRYVGKLVSSFTYVNRLTEAETKQLGENVIVHRLKGVAGVQFFAQLRALVSKHKPDLVVINPIYLYAEGDISRSEYAQPFLLGLDAVNREEKFGYILVHHTGKPAKREAGKERVDVEDWESVYMGFGSSYLANWPRCSALLEPGSERGSYVIKLGKGGLNAGVCREVDQGAGKRLEPVTRIACRHSTQVMKIAGRDRPVYYWEVDEDQGKTIKAAPASRPADKFRFSEFRSLFDKGKDKGKVIQQVMRDGRLKLGYALPKEALAAIRQWAEDGVLGVDNTNENSPKYYLP